MELSLKPFTVHKRFPLTISRGTSSENTNLWLRLQADGIEGWGEATPFSIAQGGKASSEVLWAEFVQIIPSLELYHPLEREKIAALLRQAEASAPVRAAVDMALLDWLGKRSNLPLWQLWGLDLASIVPTSVTVGIGSPEAAQKRVQNWLQVIDVQIIKVKMGSPQGIEADKCMLTAIRELMPHARLTVDANGGWSLSEAVKMCDWLATQKVEYVEQPLAAGREGDLQQLKVRSPLPLFVDESCFNSQDILRLAAHVGGINIKIMKAGGLSEAMRMIHIARACGLQVMFGCYSDSSLANTAMFHLAPLADYVDLDSHLNLIDDPFTGVQLERGRLLPNYLPGLGVSLRDF